MNEHPQPCDLCSRVSSEVKTGYLCVVRQALPVGVVVSRWINLRCLCCDRCVQKARQIKQRRCLGCATNSSFQFFFNTTLLGVLSRNATAAASLGRKSQEGKPPHLKVAN